MFIRLYQHCVNKRFAALRDIHLLWRLNKTPFDIAFDVTKVRDLFGSIHIQFNVTVFCRDTLRPAPNVLHRYKQVFTAYVKYEKKNYGRNARNLPAHSLQASTQFRLPHEHEELLGTPEW
ncbi:hypothetical protein HBI52_111660 [Parastagonospora nodorum]|nr:hypothetical protein HBH43_008250 [Parastagonospora nodorum]KAH5208243.1 hypothetical protein HBH68_085070 [Parastagonospora nodorum]KAH5376630.1 hypothetical protein HBI48_012320 [Parastagonospora nodorum]KAH5470839.1 hypothetical protein HBI28_153140 [Parastagonospora nodorum]KAH5515271.1 hypothetical protein HBI52_111660 [Parastagonospora nodorum]